VARSAAIDEMTRTLGRAPDGDNAVDLRRSISSICATCSGSHAP
jgi:hypothetical protein